MDFDQIMNRKEISFTDREHFFNLVCSEYTKLCHTTGYFKVLSWYGMGGIGKTRLLSEIKNMIERKFLPNDHVLKLICLKLEIAQSDNLLNALVHIRSQVGCPCPLFDYALITYWNRVQITKFNDDFLKTLRTEWFKFFIKAGEFASFPVSTLSEFVSLPLDTLLSSFEKTYHLINKMYNQKKYGYEIEKMKRMNTVQLQHCLGGFLGMELNRLFHTKHLIIMIDAYEKYDSSSFVDWLNTLICETYTGLFIVTSREKLFNCSISDAIYKNEQIKKLPPEEVSILLTQELPNATGQYINHVIEITECIPIYLDLAVNTYRNMYQDGLTCLNNFMYQDKNDLVRQFFNHLKEGEQEFMLTLSLIQLFNQDIFEYFAEKLHEISPFKYYKIRSLSFISNIEYDSSFYKVHNVITANVIKILAPDIRYRIFQIYLNFIHSKMVFFVSSVQKVTLYKHLVNMIIQNKFQVDELVIEQLLDIFFDIKQTLNNVDFSGIKKFKEYSPLHDFYYFTLAVYREREDSLVRLKWLNKINADNCRFGKHKKALTIISGYLNEWCGNHISMKNALEQVEPFLTDDEIREWYYAQAKIFFGDYLTINGDFKHAERVLKEFLNKILKFPEQMNSAFQAKRHLGHLYRFNLMFEQANKYYLSTRDKHKKYETIIQEIYIVTNLCETNCYLYPDIVLKNCNHGLKLGKALNDSKSIAKIYYSLAIACLHDKKFKRARKYIKRSIFYNQKDGYLLGTLFPMLATVFLQQCCRLPLCTKPFDRLLEKVQVYSFLRLPIAMLKRDINTIRQIENEYQWLDFNETITCYQMFFDKIGISSML